MTIFISFTAIFAAKFDDLITVISGTNRPGSLSIKIANIYSEYLQTCGAEASILSLENQPVWERSEPMLRLENEQLIPSNKFIFILPEYNASFPGIVKVMMDNSDIKKCWWHKKAMLTGISEGRAGNIRGLEHMTSILHYLKVNVHYNKLLLSRIKEETTTDGLALKPETLKAIHSQIDEFIIY